MRELTAKYDNAHGSEEPVIVATVEPERPKRREEPKWHERVLTFIRDAWEKYLDSMSYLVTRLNLDDGVKTRLITVFLGILVAALVLTGVTFIVMAVVNMIKTIRNNAVLRAEAAKEFIPNMKQELEKRVLEPIEKINSGEREALRQFNDALNRKLEAPKMMPELKPKPTVKMADLYPSETARLEKMKALLPPPRPVRVPEVDHERIFSDTVEKIPNFLERARARKLREHVAKEFRLLQSRGMLPPEVDINKFYDMTKKQFGK